MTSLLYIYKRMIYSQNYLDCQSEVRILGVKKEKNPKFTMTKGVVLSKDVSRFSEPEVADTDEVGMTLTGW